jgi:tetratricopeptide (TPR) repeat protein
MPPVFDIDAYIAEGGVELYDETDRYALSQDHFVIARNFERRGEHALAEQFYQIAFDFWPKSRHIRRILLDRYMRAEAHEKAFSLFFREGEVLSDLTVDEKRTVSLLYLRLGEANKAIEALESLGSDKSNEEIYSLALMHNSIGRKDKAFAGFRAFFNASEHSAGQGLRLVRLNLAERRIADAETLAVILRGAYPNNAEATALLGSIKYMNRDTVAAISYLNEALEIDANNEEALRMLAIIHSLRETFPEAVSYYRRLLALREDALGHYGRGLAFLLFHLQEYEEAEQLFDALIRTDQIIDRTDLHLYRGLTRLLTKRYSEAEADFEAVLAGDSANLEAWLHLGNALAEQKRIDEAANALRAALRIDPGNPYAANNLGYIWADAGIMLDSAKILIAMALEKEPERAAFLDSYAWVFYKMGDYKKALHYINKAIEHIDEDRLGDYSIIYEHLGDILFKLEDYVGAETAYKRSLELEAEDAERIRARLEEIRKILRGRR